MHDIAQYDKGSFRDHDGSIFYYGTEVYRSLTKNAASRMKKLIEEPFFNEWVTSGKLVETKIINSSSLFSEAPSYITPEILWHKKIPTITYPFEWTFSMLKDAAALTLDLMILLLENNYILKDGTAWNVCFHEGRPCFYDILSIDFYEKGQTWDGFSQFLQEFIYPLMLQSYHGIDFQPIWRSTQQGVPAKLLYKTLSKWDFFKKGVFKYVVLNEKLLESKTVSKSTLQQQNVVSAFSKNTLLAILHDLKACLHSLSVKTADSTWQNYTSKNTYKSSDTTLKENFVQEALEKFEPKLTIDLGCNTGQYSLLAAKKSPVIACDLDPVCVDMIYQRNNKRILPVVMNLMTPSPAIGWRLNERKDFFSRINSDTFLALALIHHLCITHNVPLNSFVEFLKSVAPQGVVEWVDKKDPMVQFLLRNRKDIFSNYNWETFENIVSQHFNIENIISINDQTRKLLLLRSKN